MKKVYLFLATMVAALSSCMEESALVPVTPENQVTIKAVAGETKTTLDGTAVIWEANDEIAVVLDKNLVTFAVEGTPNGAEANFVGTIASKDFETAYAVYPATAYSYDQTTTKVTLTHTLPAEQSGSVASGLNLSTAALSVEDLKAGEAEGVFYNALTLLKVTAPAGVKNVKFSVPHSKPALVGTATVTVNTQTGFAAVSGANGYEVTLANGSELDPAVTYDVLVYPANSTDLTLTMEGTDGTVYTSTVEGVELKASTFKTINLANIFKMETKETMNISPAGGELVVPVYTANDYTYEVTGCPSWLSCTLPTKGFHKDEIVFSADANETGEERSASVTISWGDGQTRTFTVAQAAIFMDFVSDAEGNPIKWEESFGLYSSESDAKNGTNAKKTYKNVFTIALSDNFNSGTYKISNMFYAERYNDANLQPVSNKGGEYYAYYEKGVLTINMANSVKSYGSMPDVKLKYDAVEKTFAPYYDSESDSRAIPAYNYTDYRTYYIGGYSAAVKVEEPAGPGADLGDAAKVLGNTYKESYSLSAAYGNTPGNLVFAESDDTSKGNVIITNIFGCKATGMYATVSGNTITTVQSAYIEYLQGTTPIGQLTLTIGADGNITMSDQLLYNYFYLENYVATKEGGAVDPLEAFKGTWTETYVNKPYSWSQEKTFNGEFTVSVVDGKLLFENMFAYGTYGAGSYLGTLSSDGSTITLEDNAQYGHPYHGPMSASGTIVLQVTDGTLTVSSAYNNAVANYVATKKQ